MKAEEFNVFMGGDLNVPSWGNPEFKPELVEDKSNLKVLSSFLNRCVGKLSLNAVVSLLGLEPKTVLEMQPKLAKSSARVQTLIIVRPYDDA